MLMKVYVAMWHAKRCTKVGTATCVKSTRFAATVDVEQVPRVTRRRAVCVRRCKHKLWLCARATSIASTRPLAPLTHQCPATTTSALSAHRRPTVLHLTARHCCLAGTLVSVVVMPTGCRRAAIAQAEPFAKRTRLFAVAH